MAKITKTGIGPWKKTIVEHAGNKDVFSGSAKITKEAGVTCVEEEGFFSSNTVCYVEDDEDTNKKGGLPDGTIVGSSTEISVEMKDGTKRRYESSIMGINSMVKEGNQLHIVKKGLFGNKVIDVVEASQVASIKSEDCNVCKGINPLYTDE